MSLTLADKEPLEVTVEDLRDVIDLWADREARTRAKVTSVVRAFWGWAEEHDQVPFSPAAKLRRPRAPRHAAPLLPQTADARLLNAATTARDRVALLLLLDLGIRRSELTGVRPRDIDLGRRQITVFGKGQKSRVIPLRGRIVLELEAYLLEPLPLARSACPSRTTSCCTRKSEPAGASSLRAYPKRRMSAPTVHRWWYRHAAAAGLVGEGMTSGLNMHRARHTFATDLRRVADLGRAFRRSDTPTFRRRPRSTGTTTSASWSARWSLARARVLAEQGRSTETVSIDRPEKRLVQAVDGGGGNRTRVRGCTDRTSTSVVRALVSLGGRGRTPYRRASLSFGCRASGDRRSFGSEPDRWRPVPRPRAEPEWDVA